MLTISQLAAYASVTVRAVRHYHKIGLLPEPQRNDSGYRTYDAAAVVRLIRINTLARSGVPLARVHELLDASEESSQMGCAGSTTACAERSAGSKKPGNGSPSSPPETTSQSRPASLGTSIDCAASASRSDISN